MYEYYDFASSRSIVSTIIIIIVYINFLIALVLIAISISAWNHKYSA